MARSDKVLSIDPTASPQDFLRQFAEAEAQYYALRQTDPAAAGDVSRMLSLSLKERFPFIYSAKRIAFYGTGRISACILSVIEQFAKDINAEVIFLHTRKVTGDRFRGYPVYNAADLAEARPDIIVIASVDYADEIRRVLDKAGWDGLPPVSVPQEIRLLLENYERWRGGVVAPPAIVESGQDTFRRDTEPFCIEKADWQNKDLLCAFPAIREKVTAIIDPGHAGETFLGIPILAARPENADGMRIRELSDVLAEYLEYHEIVEYTPIAMRLDVSTVCQLNCAGCYMRKENYGTVGRGYIRAAQVRKLLDENPGIRKMELSNNGEPFCNPEMYEILKILHEKNILIQLWNGTNLNDVPDRVLDALVRFDTDTITVSLDGVTQEVYAQYRRNGNIEKVYRNIRKINELKKKYKREHPLLRWQFILMNHNQHEAAAAKKMAEELGMEIFFKPDWSGGFIEDRSLHLHEVTGMKEVGEEEYYIGENHMFGSAEMCAQMILSPQVNWDGKLLGCCNVYKSDWGVNIFETPLSEIFNDANYRAAVLSLLRGRDGMDHTGPCRKCGIYEKNVISSRYRLPL